MNAAMPAGWGCTTQDSIKDLYEKVLQPEGFQVVSTKPTPTVCASHMGRQSLAVFPFLACSQKGTPL